ncbi:membrane protein [Acrocarpospora phusangensis]|uniref:Membrane protein n=1 Tax=Acrocarpospora phusangensis TaxID=1070424 RepID=A0A919QII9_9ACTN|nr:helix-turn-helix domain-containing protein [Acrocarpospora phusangensis]GIH29684.1 membrane protein [Acrocarpospora phusangensis]
MSIGATLSGARQSARLSVSELSELTRIREAVIDAVERDDFSSCGGDFYARGHLRALAKALGQDPDVIVREFDETHAGKQGPVSATEFFKCDNPIKLYERPKANWTMAMAAALGVVLVFGLIRIMGSTDAPVKSVAKVAPAAPKAQAKPAVPVTRPVTAVADLVTVKISATNAAWVKVRDVNNKILYQGMISTGDSETFRTRKKIKLTFRDAGAVRLEVNGKDLGAPGRTGEKVRRSFGPGVPSPR